MAAAKKKATKKATVKKPTAKKAVAKKTVAKKPTAKKVAAKKPAVKKAPVKKQAASAVDLLTKELVALEAKLAKAHSGNLQGAPWMHVQTISAPFQDHPHAPWCDQKNTRLRSFWGPTR